MPNAYTPQSYGPGVSPFGSLASALGQNALQAYYAGRQQDLERQKFGLAQAEAGYVPAHTEYQPKLGALAAPSYEGMGDVPSPTPGMMQPGAPTQINRGVPGQTVTDQLPGSTPVNVPGHYDLTKSLAYQTSLARVLEMQTRGEEAARIAANSRVQVAGMNDATRTGISNNVNGYYGADNQFHPGVRVLGNEALSGFNNGQWVTGPNGQPVFQPGVATQGKIAAAAPAIAERATAAAASTGERAQAAAGANASRAQNQNRLSLDALNAQIGDAEKQRAVLAKQMPAMPVLGFQSPTDSATYAQKMNAWRTQDAALKARADSLSAVRDRVAGGITGGNSGYAPLPPISQNRPGVSGPVSSASVNGLQPNFSSAGKQPTITLGNRQVANQHVTPTSDRLPARPDQATGANAPAGGGGTRGDMAGDFSLAAQRYQRLLNTPGIDSTAARTAYNATLAQLAQKYQPQ